MFMIKGKDALLNGSKYNKAVSNMKILIIEDSASFSLILTKILKNMGFDLVENVTSSEKATFMVESSKYDVIFIDNQLEGLDGEFALPIINELSPTSKLIIMSENMKDVERLSNIYKNVILKSSINEKSLKALIS